MEQRASLEPPEEEEEESPVVNGNGVAITPGTITVENALYMCCKMLSFFSNKK